MAKIYVKIKGIHCQNCDTKFHINKVGEKKGGCNHPPSRRTNLSKSYAESFKDKFTNWQGPTN